MNSAVDRLPPSSSYSRIPKLHFRAPADADEVRPVDATPLSPASPSSTRNRDTPTNRTSEEHHDHHMHAIAASPSASLPSAGSQEKRKRGVLSFLTLKEPSASAWGDFAQQQRAEAAKGFKPSGTQSQKLPDTVPKVNSKWDGLPKVAYERERSSSSASWKRSADVSRPTSKRSGDNRKDFNSLESSPPTKHRASGSDTRAGPSMSIESVKKTEKDEPFTGFAPGPDTSFYTSPKSAPANSPRIAQPTVPPSVAPMPQSVVVRGLDRLGDAAEPPVVQRDRNQAKEQAPALSATNTSNLNGVSTETSNVLRIGQKSQSATPPTEAASAPYVRAAQQQQDPNTTADAPDIPMYRRRPQETASEPSADSSPYAPLTPEEPADSEMHPAVRHTRKRSTEDAPQWPLPRPSSDDPTPPLPPKSSRRSSVGSMEEVLSTPTRLSSESDGDKWQLDRLLGSPSRQTAAANGTRIPVRSFSRPLAVAPAAGMSSVAMPMGTISIVRNQQMYTSSSTRAAPAFQPGRVVTKDSDLATIPESDTASVLHMPPTTSSSTKSADRPPLRTTMDFSDSDDDDDDDDGDDYQSAAVGDAAYAAHRRTPSSPTSAGSSEMSDDWHKSPRERLGLGGFIRRGDAKDMLWQSPPGGGLGLDGDDNNGAAPAGAAKPGVLRGVFKRT